jgi:hypothetical protein
MATRVIDRGVVTEITTNGVTRVAPERPHDRTAPVVWAVLRVLMGATFLWAFLDKAFALGFSTGRNPETGAIDFFGDWPARRGSSGSTCCRCCSSGSV